MKIKLLFSLAILLTLRIEARCSTHVTLFAHGNGSSTITNVTLTVTNGQLARIIYWNAASASLSMSVGGSSFLLVNGGIDVSTKTPIVVGPATITLSANNNNYGLCTIELLSPSEPFTPSNAVVIPADAGGPVNIILESSTDLITWTSASPGTYGTSTEKRFFRVRAERTQ